MQGKQQEDAARVEAIARSIREPDMRTQQERAERRAAWARDQARRRQAASFALVGVVIGAGVAVWQGQQIGRGALWGGLAGSAFGWMIGCLREHARAR